MKFPIAIEPGNKRQAYGVVVPDLPGCFSAGDTLDEAFANAREAIELWLETVIDDGGAVPKPGFIAEHQANPQYAGWVWGVVEVDLGALSNKAERINITLPSRILRRIDKAAKVSGDTRSGFIAMAAISAASGMSLPTRTKQLRRRRAGTDEETKEAVRVKETKAKPYIVTARRARKRK